MEKCFVIQPFDGGTFDRRYMDTFKPAIEEAGLEPYRVDEDPGVEIPIEDIEKGIREAVVCFAEITTDKPNVWYELGFSIACGKRVVMVCETTRERFPFDVQHRSIIRYDVGSASDFQTLKVKIIAKLKAFCVQPPSSEDAKPFHQAQLKLFNQAQLQVFDRRMEIYDAVMEFSSKLVQKGEVTQADFTKYGRKARNARIFFNDDVQRYCDEIYKNAGKLMIAHGVINTPQAAMHNEMSTSYGETLLWFNQQIVSGANTVFTPFLHIDS